MTYDHCYQNKAYARRYMTKKRLHEEAMEMKIESEDLHPAPPAAQQQAPQPQPEPQPEPIKIDSSMARKLFDKIDKNHDESITLSELIFSARDNSSEEGVLLHSLLGLPHEVYFICVFICK